MVPKGNKREEALNRLKQASERILGSEFHGMSKPRDAIWNGKLQEVWGECPLSEKQYNENLIQLFVNIARLNKYLARSVAKDTIWGLIDERALLANRLLQDTEMRKNLQDLLSKEDFQKLENLAKEAKKSDELKEDRK